MYRHEKSRKPANLVCGNLFVKVWTFLVKPTRKLWSLYGKVHNVFGWVNSLWQSLRYVGNSLNRSHSVDISKICKKVHIFLTNPYYLLKIAIFYTLLCGHFPAWKSGLWTYFHVWGVRSYFKIVLPFYVYIVPLKHKQTEVCNLRESFHTKKRGKLGIGRK